MKDGFDPNEIRSLDGLEGIRMRPQMYVGDVQDPATITTLLQEATCLALDNVVTECASCMRINLNSDGSASIRDDGPGLDFQTGKHGHSAVDDVFTRLYACREGKKEKLHSQEVCGVGIVVTNALSEWLTYEATHDGCLWRQEYEAGVAKGGIQDLGPTNETFQEVRFKPDERIFGTHQVSSSMFIQWFQELSIPLGQTSIELHASDGTMTQLNSNAVCHDD